MPITLEAIGHGIHVCRDDFMQTIAEKLISIELFKAETNENRFGIFTFLYIIMTPIPFSFPKLQSFSRFLF